MPLKYFIRTSVLEYRSAGIFPAPFGSGLNFIPGLFYNCFFERFFKTEPHKLFSFNGASGKMGKKGRRYKIQNGFIKPNDDEKENLQARNNGRQVQRMRNVRSYMS